MIISPGIALLCRLFSLWSRDTKLTECYRAYPMRIKAIARRIPGVKNAWHLLRQQYTQRRLKDARVDDVFTDIYKNNAWNGAHSLSGPGSDLDQTRVIIQELPRLLQDLQVTTLLDIPCGDFHWINQVNLEGLHYQGADIVAELIHNNRKNYEKENVLFHLMNLLQDDLPQVDLILCRDCLVHLSHSDIFLALQNLCRSRSTYLLATTFTERDKNDDILTGEWRPLNLEAPPFHLPAPQCLLNEACTEGGGVYRDKSLGLWSVETIASTLENSSR